jgi:acetolactate synthase I/III small subunit
MTALDSAVQNGRHEFALLVRDKPGVLVRIALVFARRGFNIERLDVGPAGSTGFSEMSIVSRGAPQSVEQIGKQLAKLIDVVTVNVSPRTSNAPESARTSP